MKASRTALIGAVASVALLGSAVAGIAQTSRPQNTRVIEVPPGAVVLVLPAGSMAEAPLNVAFPFADLPSPAVMVRQMDQMIVDMQRTFQGSAWTDANRTIEAALRGIPQADGPTAGVVVTSYSDGHGTCTQRVVYRGNGATPLVQVAGSACATAGLPTTTTRAVETPEPEQATPRLIHVRDITRPRGPLTYARAGQ
jgi:hypothetical protein